MKTLEQRAQTVAACRHRNSGSVAITALITLTVLAFVAAMVLQNGTRRYNGVIKAQGWQEALYAAEAGGDLGLANLRWQVVSGSPTPFDSTQGWATTTSSGNTTYTCTTPHFIGTGEGTRETWAVVTVESLSATTPAGLKDTAGKQWYRIRSTGHARVPGLARASIDPLLDINTRHNNSLRKFNLRTDRATGQALTIPETTRTIEQIIEPKVSGGWALLARTSLTIGSNQIIDSYNSTDSSKSTLGLYDPTKRQNNGNVATDGSASSALVIGSGEKVYGNASTNGGTFTDPNHTIQSPGTINNTTNNALPIIPDPTWGTAGSPSINGSVSTVSSSTVIPVNADSAQNFYKLTNITAPLTFLLPAGQTTGTINIWLTGGATTSGSISIPKGVTVNVYFTGDTFHPRNDSGVVNLNKDPSTFNIYGCGTYAGGGPGIDIHVGASATAVFYGTVYAPYRTINLKYDGGTNYDPNYAHYGSFVGNTIKCMSSVHYDEAGSLSGNTTDYKQVSYVEDPR